MFPSVQPALKASPLRSVISSAPTKPSTSRELESPPVPAHLATVLLIDDQEIIGEAVRRVLMSETDIQFHYCSDPTQAIHQALTIKPTVILLDLVMPDLDGLMLVRWLRNHAETKDVPIVVLSTKEEAKLKAEAFAQGANDYLVKLPEAVELIARIRYHSKAYINLRALSAATITAQQKTQQLEQTLDELRSTQSQLIQTEKMSSLGQMVAGIAHEINNPVNFIYGNINYVRDYAESLMSLIQLYQQECSTPSAVIQNKINTIELPFLLEDLPNLLNSMQLGADRIREIVLSLRNFSRLDESERKSVNVHEGIDSTLLILNHRFEKGIELIKEYADLPAIECYPAQLNQVLMNILSNAIDALLMQKETSHKQVVIRTEQLENDCIKVRIRDNGPGIPKSIKDKIFTPFFTTKPINQGTGLGLAICYQIIEKHQGAIEVISEEGQGTEFAIYLPIHPRSSR